MPRTMTVLDSWFEGGLNGMRHKAVRVSITDTGGQAATITAAELGMARLTNVPTAVADANGNALLTGEIATDGDSVAYYSNYATSTLATNVVITSMTLVGVRK